MATKFGYVERNLENDVNWSQVGKGFSDMLLAERDERKTKKANLNDLMAETQDGLRNAPLGYNTTFNDQMVGLGANSSSFVLAANKDLKAGRITPEDYMRKLHNLNSSADTTFTFANSYNKFYENKLKRMDDNISGNVEQSAFQAITDLVDFNNHDFMIDQSGMIVAAPLIKGEDGITSLDAKNAKSVQAIFNLAQNEVDKFDVQGSIDEQVARLGKNVFGTDIAATYGREGMKKVIQDMSITDPKKYKDFKDGAIGELLVNDLNVASILTDYMYPKKYNTTTDKNKWLANKDKYVYVDIENGKEILIGELTNEQREDARQSLDEAWEGQIDTSSVETAKAELTYTPTQIESFKKITENNQAKITLSTLWNQVGYGTTEQKATALEALLGNKYIIDSGMLGIRANADGTELDFIYNDKNSNLNRSIDLTKDYSPIAWADMGAEIHGESNSKKAVAAGGGWKEGITFTTFVGDNSPFKGIGSVRQGVKVQEDRVAIAQNFSNALNTTIVKNEGQQIVNALNAAGGNAKYNKSRGTITIGASDKSDGVTFNITTDSGINSTRKYIRGFIKNDYNQMKIFSSGGKMKLPGADD